MSHASGNNTEPTIGDLIKSFEVLLNRTDAEITELSPNSRGQKKGKFEESVALSLPYPVAKALGWTYYRVSWIDSSRSRTDKPAYLPAQIRLMKSNMIENRIWDKVEPITEEETRRYLAGELRE